MINLIQNQRNVIVLTLREKQTAASLNAYPYYLFNLKSDFTNDELNFIATNQSQYSNSYNLFEIYVTGLTANQNLTGGTIKIDSGSYTYKIYEQSSNTNTSISFSGVGNQLETGKVLVEDTGSTIYNLL